jgi:hypothetical protein
MKKPLKKFRFAVIVVRLKNDLKEVFIRDLWDGAEIQLENETCAENALRLRGFK